LIAHIECVAEVASLWDVEDLAERLCVSERFVRRLVAERRIPYVKVGRFVRFDPADVADWLRTARVPQRSLSQPLSILDSEFGDAGSVLRR
jgi:excisionase family DNA binding protein